MIFSKSQVRHNAGLVLTVFSQLRHLAGPLRSAEDRLAKIKGGLSRYQSGHTPNRSDDTVIIRAVSMDHENTTSRTRRYHKLSTSKVIDHARGTAGQAQGDCCCLLGEIS